MSSSTGTIIGSSNSHQRNQGSSRKVNVFLLFFIALVVVCSNLFSGPASRPENKDLSWSSSSSSSPVRGTSSENDDGDITDQMNRTNTRIVVPKQKDNKSFDLHSYSTFGQAMAAFDWSFYEQIEDKKNNETAMFQVARKVFKIGYHFSIMEPKTPINEVACNKARRMSEWSTPPTAEQCSAPARAGTSNAFTGAVRSTPRKVGHAVLFGMDPDALEIHLRELYDVVDKFFICEWTMPHNQMMNPKPLVWEALKHQERFAFCQDKVVHFIMDDVDSAHTRANDMWSAEFLQVHRRWQKIMEWNNQTNFFSDHDLIGLGDTDEVASRDNVHLLKHCEWTNNGPVDVGIWFPRRDINWAFLSDGPIRGHPYTLGDPIYYVFGEAKLITKFAGVTRNAGRSKSGKYILGGMHMTNYSFLMYTLLKALTCSECGQNYYVTVLGWLYNAAVKNGTQAAWYDLELWWGNNFSPSRLIPLDQMDPVERKKIVYLPWFYDCQRDRYPAWESRPDPRTA